MEVLREDFYTLREASEKRGVSYDALRMWVRRHNIPTKKVGTFKVVRYADVELYHPLMRAKR